MCGIPRAVVNNPPGEIGWGYTTFVDLWAAVPTPPKGGLFC